MSATGGDIDIQSGVVGGAVAWIVVFLVASVLMASGVVKRSRTTLDFVLDTVQEWHLTYLVLGNVTATSIVWIMVPVVILLLAGFIVADRTGGGAMEGASISAGYLLLAVLSVVYMLVAVDLAPATVLLVVYLILGGVVFPAVFGGIGGLIAQEV